MSAAPFRLVCVDCGRSHPGLELRYRCACGGTLDVVHDWTPLAGRVGTALFDGRLDSKAPVDRSGVWRFRELVLPLSAGEIVTKPEGNTNLYRSERLAAWVGIDDVAWKHEGENPTGSFKDRGMTVGISVARTLGMERVACASTGNTSASMASYAAAAGMKAYVFIPQGKVAFGKLSQALAYGAVTIQIAGDFDAAMRLVQEACAARGVYLLNSINPFRIEGQKTIAFELLQDLSWIVPDWIVVPGGNLGNSAALGKAFAELRDLGLIPRLPKLAVIQASGANPFAAAFREGRPVVPLASAETRATAIRIGDPISWRKSLRGVVASGGIVDEVTDQEILDAKARLDASGIGAEPASAASVAGARKLARAGVIGRGERVCGILTGHLLKDPEIVVEYHRGALPGIVSSFANALRSARPDLESVLAAMGDA
jgi:threonine synthase